MKRYNRLWIALLSLAALSVALLACAPAGRNEEREAKPTATAVALTAAPPATASPTPSGRVSGSISTRKPVLPADSPEPTATLAPTTLALGAFVAYDGSLRLAMADGRVRTVVGAADLDPDSVLAWSPDGQHLVVADRNKRLHIVDVGSGQMILLRDSGARPVAWSSDGQKLAFFFASPNESNKRWWRLSDEMRIGIVSSYGEPLNTLTATYQPIDDLDPSSYRYGPLSLFWLADDQHLALELAAVWQFEMGSRVGSQIHLAKAGADTSFSRFAGHLGEAQAVSLAPDGRTLAFVAASGEGDKLGIYRIDALGPRIVHSTPFELTSCDNCFSQWLSDGSGIVFGNRYAHRGCWFSLFQIDVANEHTRLLNQAYECEPASEFSVAPDGSGRMVYSEQEEASDDVAIELVPSADAAPVEIARMPVTQHLAWSPDGRWLAFSARSRASDQKNVFVISTDAGSEPIWLTSHPAIHAIAWSPDGQHIAVTEGDLWDPPLTTYLYALDGELLQAFEAAGLAFWPAPGKTATVWPSERRNENE